ncbi:MAG: [protein-PII] uridylyltransferase [Desulfuromonadales bacterium]|nr:[protein-PII] uridylyltransferase [Desulfuromonadales bacterium]
MNLDTALSETLVLPDVLRNLSRDASLPFADRRQALLEGAGSYWNHCWEIIKKYHRNGASGHEVVALLTEVADALMESLYTFAASDLPSKGQDGCVVIALGGYGRRQLNPRSDIDLMFFHNGKGKKFAEQVSERMLYLLWDLGIDVGYSIRTARHCLDIADRDLTARTALLDSRYLCGSSQCFAEFERLVLDKMFNWNSKGYVTEKLQESSRRLGKYTASVYLLEPNIKEGEGGLRDLHTAQWLAQVKFKARSLYELVLKGIMTERENAEFESAYDYLWRIRNELHFLSKGKNEQLRFDQQEKIALFLGYKNSKRALAVEQFMQDYYAHAVHVEEISTRLIEKVRLHDQSVPTPSLGTIVRRTVEDGFYVFRGELRLADSDLFEEHPEKMMLAFRLAQLHEVALSLQVKNHIRANLHRINNRVRRSKVMAKTFMDILRGRRGVLQALQDMHYLRFLNHFIPEFGRIYCKVQHDAYHIFTVDTHSLFAIGELIKVWEGEYAEELPRLTSVSNDIEKRELLLLAMLLHDVGKGEGRDHCNKGADMMPTVARRLGLSREDSRRLEFLVRHHLLMAHISQRRDMHDDRLIVDFARTMGMSENLKMLYLLTFADLKAVGPDVWTAWKSMLLRELFDKTHLVLERGNFLLEKRSEKIRNRKRKVQTLLEDEIDPKVVADRLRKASTRYLLSFRSHVIAEHIRLIQGSRDKRLGFFVADGKDGSHTELTIVTHDMPGLFTMITGVMAAYGINILGAQIFTQRDGTAFDILHVKGPTGYADAGSEKWRFVEDSLLAVIEGRQEVEDLINKRHRPAFWTEAGHPKAPSRVDIDNEVSREYTVVDVYTHDEVGVLYRICRTLRDLGLYLGVAKISTKVDQVADTFYVQDIFSQKIRDPQKIEEIRLRLLSSLDEEKI